MKKLFTLIFVSMFVLPAFAQHTMGSRHFLRESKPNLNLTDSGQFTANRQLPAKSALAIMQQLDSQEYQEYDVTNSQWVNSSLDKYTYNGSGNNTLYVISEWNPASELYEPSYQEELSYSDGMLSERVISGWDAIASVWELYEKYTYTYNASANIILSYSYFYDEPDWILSGKDELNYNGSGNLTLNISYYWDESGNDWKYAYKNEHTYNGNGFLTVSTMSYWDIPSNEWQKSHKSENTYNGNGQQIIVMSYFTWDEGSSQWINETRDEYTYDGNSNLVMGLGQEWDNGQWVNTYKAEVSYNNAYPFEELVLPWSYIDYTIPLFVHMPVEIIQWNYIGSSYVLSDKVLFKFSGINITDVPNVQVYQIALYPQPADGYVTFKWENNSSDFDLDLYNINGSLVMESKITSNKTVAIDHLASGLYFYRLTDNAQHSISGKLSVR